MIAIQPDNQRLTSGRHQSFSDRWVELAREAGHEVRLVNALSPSFFDQLDGCDGFMWWFAHLPFPRNFAKRLLPAIEHGLGIPVFPDWRTIWHFDDKIAQSYLLQAAGIPIPQTWVFWRLDEARAFCRNATYPLVIKLASGIVSENVRLLRSPGEAEYWICRLFGPGLVSLERPRAFRPRTGLERLRGAARLLLTGRLPDPGRFADVQKGYLLVQGFIPGNEFDLRVTVFGDRAFGFRRFNRPNDFRASGSGRIDWDPSPIETDAVRLAFRVAQVLKTQEIAVDVLRRGGEHVIGEISYYYEGWAIHACPGHWRLFGDWDTGELRWMQGQVLPEDAIWENFLAHVEDWSSRAVPEA